MGLERALALAGWEPDLVAAPCLPHCGVIPRKPGLFPGLQPLPHWF